METSYLREAELSLVISVFKMSPCLPITTMKGVFIQFPKLHKEKEELIKQYISM